MNSGNLDFILEKYSEDELLAMLKSTRHLEDLAVLSLKALSNKKEIRSRYVKAIVAFTSTVLFEPT